MAWSYLKFLSTRDSETPDLGSQRYPKFQIHIRQECSRHRRHLVFPTYTRPPHAYPPLALSKNVAKSMPDISDPEIGISFSKEILEIKNLDKLTREAGVISTVSDTKTDKIPSL